MAVVLTLLQTKDIRINTHKRNNTKTQYKQYKTQLIQVNILLKHPHNCQDTHIYTHPHITKLTHPHITKLTHTHTRTHKLQNPHIHTHTNYKTHTQITKPTHTHTHTRTLQNPCTHTPTHYKIHTYTLPHITKPTHTHTYTHTHPHITKQDSVVLDEVVAVWTRQPMWML